MASERFRPILSIAARQHGLFSLEQAARCAGSRAGAKRVLAAGIRLGLWSRVYRGVFRIAGAPPSLEQRALAACLAVKGSAASHLTAAAIWGIVETAPDVIEVTLPRGRRARIPGVICHESRDIIGADLTDRAGVRVTSAARTLIDLAATLDEHDLEDALDEAVRRRLVTVARIRWRLSRLNRRPGLAALRGLVDDLLGRGTPASRYERKVIRILRAVGLPAPVRQYEVRAGGRLLARVDLAYPPPDEIALEYDGRKAHRGWSRRKADSERQNKLETRGWIVLRYTRETVDDEPDELAADVARALARRRIPGRRSSTTHTGGEARNGRTR